eukprot:TRINITY_DN254_c0_g1_i1.p1 TRINITY_DN254_c0_g1~~TRINITY_DN254_c0_g1_i1.p1  ORF type:complete len:516 (-),score=58.15 TRINITY_DN254_c0_g1_i1:74-1621(-)
MPLFNTYVCIWSLFAFSVNSIQFHNVERPNLLFIMTDQQRFDAMSSAGNTVLKTPNMDRIAHEGVTFRNAYTANPVCVPARSTLLTGYSSVNVKLKLKKSDGAVDRTEPQDVRTFDSVLVKYGYSAEYYGKWHAPNFTKSYDNAVMTNGERQQAYLQWRADKGVQSREPVDGELISRAHRLPYTPIRLDGNYHKTNETAEAKLELECGGQYGKVDLPPNMAMTHFIGEQALEALERMKGGPFTLTCSFPPPHPPHVVEDPYFSMYPPEHILVSKSIDDSMVDSPYYSEEEVQPTYRFRDSQNIKEMSSIYYGMIKQVDDMIGKILDKLDDLGIADKTLVFFVADHGEMLGDHGLYGKQKFYEGSAHVPFLMRFPGRIKPGSVVEEPVSQMDVFATILDYMNVQIPESDGESLRPLIEGTGEARDVISYSSGKTHPNYMIRVGDWKLMMCESGTKKCKDALYDLKADPLEMRNLIASPISPEENQAQAQMMKKRLLKWLKHHEPHKVDDLKARSLF